ncbi:MAG: hypothetical protein CL741_05350 [Chloroflexi bacterium]|nr:hypothetical protein [Chloroflexota bacterium]
MAVDLVVGVRDGELHVEMLPTVHNAGGSSIHLQIDPPAALSFFELTSAIPFYGEPTSFRICLQETLPSRRKHEDSWNRYSPKWFQRYRH